MTCIVGFVDGSTVWMGGDSAGVGGYDLTVRSDQKVFKNGPMLFGFTSSFRMGQLLRYALTVPDHDPRIEGWAAKKNEQEHGGCFLVGYKGRLFTIHEDYQVAVPADGFAAVGCGDQIAHGALFATAHLVGRERVELALKAAERFSAGVRGPFTIESMEHAQ